MAEAKEWFVYVLQSTVANRTYVGSAVDVKRRLRQHNGEIKGGGKHTQANRPWVIAAVFGPYVNRSEAFKAEIKLKHSKKGKNRINWNPSDSDMCRGLGPNDPRCTVTIKDETDGPKEQNRSGSGTTD